MQIDVIGPMGIIPDTRSVTNSGVGLTELPSAPGGKVTNLTPNGQQAAFGAAMIQAYPGGHRSTHLSANWLNDPRFKR